MIVRAAIGADGINVCKNGELCRPIWYMNSSRPRCSIDSPCRLRSLKTSESITGNRINAHSKLHLNRMDGEANKRVLKVALEPGT